MDDIKASRVKKKINQPQRDATAPSPLSTSFSAKKEPVIDIDLSEDDTQESTREVAKSNRAKSMLLRFKPRNKKQILGLIIVLLLIIFGLILLISHKSPKKVTVVASKVVTAPVVKSDLVPSTLSGLPVDPSINKLPVTGVMIENSEDARPQSGLSQASVVFEALAEGGITRFLALYQDTAPSNLGPIRSVRPYYLQWALGFDASIAHVGGSPDALNDVKTWNVKNLDEFYNGSSYHRITTREAPHNVYTSIDDLNQLETSKGYTSTNFSGFVRKEAKPLKVPTAATINMNLSSADYNVQYTYDSTTDSYNRAEGGATMTDANTNTQISPKVVVAIVLPLAQGALDASGAYYSNYNPIGSGVAYVFQDGGVTVGKWTKSSNTSQITFADATGKSIPLDPGQTWITSLSSSNQVIYTP